MKEKIQNLFYQTEGKFTEELALSYSEKGQGYLPERLHPDGIIKTVCGFCSTGCSLDAHMRGNEAVNLVPTADYPVNLGEACPKGWESLTPLKASDRAVAPLQRDEKGNFVTLSWHDAMTTFVDNFTRVQQRYGKDSVAFLSTGQIPTEEMVMLGSLAKFGMGMLHGDGNTRQCMATAATAYKESFGFDAPPFTYKDFEESDVIVFVGANPCIAHPIMWERVQMNRNDPEIIVIDPRKTETAMAATRHYAITPKSDLIFLYAIANILIQEGWIKKDYIKKFTQGFDDFKGHVAQYTPETASRVSGIAVEDLYALARIIHQGERVSFWWTMGVNQSYEAVRTAQAIINLTLMTGNIGRPGTGANSITGQCNAMGSRLFSNTTNLLGGHNFESPEDRKKIAEILNIDVNKIPTENSLAYDQIIEAVAAGKIKGLWIVATNPVHSWINQNELRETFKKLDYLVVQDMYHTTETAQMAHLILPSAGWGEKEGTFINSERRFGVTKKVAKAPGEALADFYIFKLVAEYWGCAGLFEEWKTPQDVFQTMKEISKDQPCDISGMEDYSMLERCGGMQWPFTSKDNEHDTERRLFEDGKFYHKDGKAHFIFEEPKENPEPVNEDFPFELLTGRGTSSQWHTQTRTGKSEVLKKMYPKDVYVEINTKDANSLNIQQNDWVYVSTRRATVKARAFIVPTLKPGVLFMPMHYEETNKLTFPSFDPYSRQPSYKTCAANVLQNRYEQV